ncbi:MAG: hypothetical protein R2711_08560 [Acidimicrobiales bacterium]
MPFVVKVFAAGDEALDQARSYGADAIMIDTPGGGTGQVFDWSLAEERPDGIRTILAGGLTPENVGEAVRRVKPWGVDVATGWRPTTATRAARTPARSARLHRGRPCGAPDDEGFGPDPGTGAPYDWMQDGSL